MVAESVRRYILRMASREINAAAEVLRRAPWLASLGADLPTAMANAGRLVRLKAGQWTHAEGDSETGIVFVIEGALQLYVNAPGDREVLIAHAEEGSAVGQTSRFGGGPRIVTAVCVVDSLLLVVSDSALARLGAERPDTWKAAAALGYAQVRATTHAMAELIGLPHRQRLAARLLAIAAPTRRPAPVMLHIDQRALGEIAGVSRKTANRILAGFESEGLVRLGYRRIKLLDLAGLERVAAS